MRVHAEPIAVRPLAAADDDQDAVGGPPAQFIWRRKLWRVLAVQRCWVEAGQWWDDPRVRRARGQDEEIPSGEAVGEVVDLLSEQYVYRVEAVVGASQEVGVYELARRGQQWRLRAVID